VSVLIKTENVRNHSPEFKKRAARWTALCLTP
jgi:hypothetical protein